jgi:hypothetical protein
VLPAGVKLGAVADPAQAQEAERCCQDIREGIVSSAFFVLMTRRRGHDSAKTKQRKDEQPVEQKCPKRRSQSQLAGQQQQESDDQNPPQKEKLTRPDKPSPQSLGYRPSADRPIVRRAPTNFERTQDRYFLHHMTSAHLLVCLSQSMSTTTAQTYHRSLLETPTALAQCLRGWRGGS